MTRHKNGKDAGYKWIAVHGYEDVTNYPKKIYCKLQANIIFIQSQSLYQAELKLKASSKPRNSKEHKSYCCCGATNSESTSEPRLQKSKLQKL